MIRYTLDSDIPIGTIQVLIVVPLVYGGKA